VPTLTPGADHPSARRRYSLGRRHYSQPPSEIELRAWHATIGPLHELGLTPMGVPLDIILDLYAVSDDHLRRSLDTLWDAA
jgi:hypothetical protein